MQNSLPLDKNCLCKQAKASSPLASCDEWFFARKQFTVLTACRLAWPDGWVDSQWPELHETLDAMPARVSVENQLVEDLHRAMGIFMQEHPQWDQYQLVQAAIARFLFQQGSKDPVAVRQYHGCLFRREQFCAL